MKNHRSSLRALGLKIATKYLRLEDKELLQRTYPEFLTDREE
jgi:hypothetical protein